MRMAAILSNNFSVINGLSRRRRIPDNLDYVPALGLEAFYRGIRLAYLGEIVRVGSELFKKPFRVLFWQDEMFRNKKMACRFKWQLVSPRGTGAGFSVRIALACFRLRGQCRASQKRLLSSF